MESEFIARWRRKGLVCLLRHIRAEFLVGRRDEWFCGYVGVGRSHPYYGKGYDDYDDIGDIDVHGGLTFSESIKGEKDRWFFGFDCAHSMDDPLFGGTPKDYGYAMKETNCLADQLSKIGGKTSGRRKKKD